MEFKIGIYEKMTNGKDYRYIDRPVHGFPDYKLRRVLEKSMDWEFDESLVYNCEDIMPKIEKGIWELTHNIEEYRQYEPGDKTLTSEDALRTLIDTKDTIYNTITRHNKYKRSPDWNIIFPHLTEEERNIETTIDDLWLSWSNI